MTFIRIPFSTELTNQTARVFSFGCDWAEPKPYLHVGGTDEAAARFAELAQALREGVRLPSDAELSAEIGKVVRRRQDPVPRNLGRLPRDALPSRFSFYQGAW